jgi:hypothetical protein
MADLASNHASDSAHFQEIFAVRCFSSVFDTADAVSAEFKTLLICIKDV